MNSIQKILDEALTTHKHPVFRIVATGGFRDIESIAYWCSDQNIQTAFDAVDLNGYEQSQMHTILHNHDVAQYCTFHTQDHKKFLNDLTWVDIVFISAGSLQEGIQEFQLAVSAGAKTVVMRDYQKNASFAVAQAKKFGWAVESIDDISVIKRQ